MLGHFLEERVRVGNRHPGGTVPVLWREVAGVRETVWAALGDPENYDGTVRGLCGDAAGAANAGKLKPSMTRGRFRGELLGGLFLRWTRARWQSTPTMSMNEEPNLFARGTPGWCAMRPGLLERLHAEPGLLRLANWRLVVLGRVQLDRQWLVQRHRAVGCMTARKLVDGRQRAGA